jgi:lipopolysaccharide/colanic/teichoic acid biosynthesis glycosyltransferase
MIYPIAKRTMDIAFSAAGLSACWPLIAALGVAVKLDSKGSAFYRSKRVGREGREFYLLKLRTMSESDGEAGVQVTAGNDRRITRLGKVLRSTKLDELPQLINVLKGDVSLVGPRPEAPLYVDKFRNQYEKILTVRPGLTDRATLAFIHEEDILSGCTDPEKTYVEEILPQKIELYLEYVDKQNLKEDVAILAATAIRLLNRSIRRILQLDRQ